MAHRKYKDAIWDFKDNTSDHATLSVLMDIRDELKEMNLRFEKLASNPRRER